MRLLTWCASQSGYVSMSGSKPSLRALFQSLTSHWPAVIVSTSRTTQCANFGGVRRMHLQIRHTYASTGAATRQLAAPASSPTHGMARLQVTGTSWQHQATSVHCKCWCMTEAYHVAGMPASQPGASSAAVRLLPLHPARCVSSARSAPCIGWTWMQWLCETQARWPARAQHNTV